MGLIGRFLWDHAEEISWILVFGFFAFLIVFFIGIIVIAPYGIGKLVSVIAKVKMDPLTTIAVGCGVLILLKIIAGMLGDEK